MFGLSVLPGIVMVAGMIYMPESPRWLTANGQEPLARTVLEKLRGAEVVEAELAEIKAVIAEQAAHGGSELDELKKPEIRQALLAGCGIMFFAQAQGINTVIYFAPKIFTFTGLDAEQAILGLVVIDAVNVACTFFSVKYMDRLPRKTWLLACSPGMGAGLVLIAVVFALPLSWAALKPPLALLALVMYVLFFCVSWGPLGWLINSEIYPLRARGICTGLSTTTCWVVNFIVRPSVHS